MRYSLTKGILEEDHKLNDDSVVTIEGDAAYVVRYLDNKLNKLEDKYIDLEEEYIELNRSRINLIHDLKLLCVSYEEVGKENKKKSAYSLLGD